VRACGGAACDAVVTRKGPYACGNGTVCPRGQRADPGEAFAPKEFFSEAIVAPGRRFLELYRSRGRSPCRNGLGTCGRDASHPAHPATDRLQAAARGDGQQFSRAYANGDKFVVSAPSRPPAPLPAQHAPRQNHSRRRCACGPRSAGRACRECRYGPCART
jgi:hypothetical protein